MAKGRRFQKRDIRVKKPSFRINYQIKLHEIRLVGSNLDDVTQVAGRTIEPGVYNTKDVLKWADQLDLDLVEISPNAIPPVCKIIDFKKFLYEKRKKQKVLKSKTAKTVIKEIRFGPNTGEHDFDFKLKHARSFLESGAKVKAYIHFRGRTIVFKDRGELLLLKFMKECEDLGKAEELPKMFGRRMTVMLSPIKKKKS